MREFAWGLVPCSHPTLRSAEYVLGMRGPRVFSLLGVMHSGGGGTRGEPPSTFFFSAKSTAGDGKSTTQHACKRATTDASQTQRCTTWPGTVSNTSASD